MNKTTIFLIRHGETDTAIISEIEFSDCAPVAARADEPSVRGADSEDF